MDGNAEAGPSRSRPTTPTRRDDSQTQDTDRPSSLEVTQKATKRRSWFGFASPAALLPASNSNGSPSKKSQAGSVRKNSRDLMKGKEEENVELDVRAVEPPLSEGVTLERGSIEEDEVLAIDGKPDQSTVKDWKSRSKRRSRGATDDSTETVRLQPLTKGPPRSSSLIHDPGGHPQSNPFANRVFSRTASDRDAAPTLAAAIGSIPRSSLDQHFEPSDNEEPDRAHLQPYPRTASTRSSMDRPLPPLPPEDTKALPSVPADIVITPSSPRKLLKSPREPSSRSLGVTAGRRSRSAGGASTSSQSTTRKDSSRQGSPIGLGLPSRPSNPEDPTSPPPPVPSKTQSVSSPLPSRTSSPTPRIAFVEPSGLPRAAGADEAEVAEGKKRVRRARSLSGFLGKAPTAVASDTPKSRPQTPTSTLDTDDMEHLDPDITIKASGVLGWFGVKKTVKRRQSEGRLKPMDQEKDALKVETEKGKSRESIGLHEELGERTGPRRPSQLGVQVELPPNTVVNEERKRSGSFFRQRRSSSRGREPTSRRTSTTSQRDEQEVESRPIPIANRRPLTATSSSSSLQQFPHLDSGSPFLGREDAWMMSSSPTEHEETLYGSETGANWGPGVRPWMDGTENRRSPRSSITSPLGSLPETGSLATPTSMQAEEMGSGKGDLQPPPVLRDANRLRSWSDAPLPQPGVRSAINASNPHLPPGSPEPNGTGQGVSSAYNPTHSTPSLQARPSMPHRSSSGNSVLLGKMRNVFTKSGSTTRGRSQTLFRQPSSDVDEFGVAQPSTRGGSDDLRSQTMRPSSSASSDVNSPRPSISRVMQDSPRTALLGLSDNDRRIFLNDNTPERSPRTSIAAASISSINSASTRHSALMETATGRVGRARASTLSSTGPSSYQPFSARSPSPNLFPTAATPPRRRPSVIQRLSSGVLRSGGTTTGPSSPRGSSLFPLPPRSSASTVSSSMSNNPGPITGGLMSDDGSAYSGTTSPRPSQGSASGGIAKEVMKALMEIKEDESPEQWLEKVISQVGRSEIANVLAASGDEYHTAALKLYMDKFDFTHNALDVALRMLLMQMSLPRETQQIDRIIEAFANRYEECEPGLFTNKDNTYVLAFSMMMLHTDAFNKSNKNKMTKADYVKNTRMDGVPPLVLEAFFDNITYTPFVFIEDDAELTQISNDPNGTLSLASATPTGSFSIASSTASAFPATPKANTANGRVDVYSLIIRNALDSLRVDMAVDIPAESPFSTLGTKAMLDTDGLHKAFVSAKNLPIVPPKRKNSAAGLLGSTPSRGSSIPEPEIILKVTRVGLLSRKDESTDSTKKTRKWKSWSVILTGSQLLFFKDPTWALNLLEQINSATSLDKEVAGEPGQLQRMINFKPDEVFPVKDCFAVYDRALLNPNTFRFIMPSGRQYLLQAADEQEMNQWITMINYASTFKSANIRMRGYSMGKDRVILAGAAAAASHQREVRNESSTNLTLQTPGSTPAQSQTTPRAPRKAVFGDTPSLLQTPAQTSQAGVKSRSRASSLNDGNVRAVPKGIKGVDVDADNDVMANEGEQLEEVFDIVKAELAAGRGGATRRPRTADPPTSGRAPETVAGSTSPTRAETIETQIRQYQAKLSLLDKALRSELRVARNLATLTPFQRSTRDRITASIPSLATKIRNQRLDIAKHQIWITVLRKDLAREQREWARMRHVALQAAAKSLRDPEGVKSVVQEVNGSNETIIPHLSLTTTTTNDPSDLGAPIDIRPGQSRGEPAVDMAHGSSPNGLSRSPGELPIIIRRPSDEPEPDLGDRNGTPKENRPTLPRNSSMASYHSSTSGHRPDFRRSVSDSMSAGHDRLRSESPVTEMGVKD